MSFSGGIPSQKTPQSNSKVLHTLPASALYVFNVLQLRVHTRT